MSSARFATAAAGGAPSLRHGAKEHGLHRKAPDGQLDPDGVQTWINSELKNYGADARLLVARAFRSRLSASRQDEPEKGSTYALQEKLFFS